MIKHCEPECEITTYKHYKFKQKLYIFNRQANGNKILGKAESYLQIDDSITYKAAYIGKSKPGKSDILNNCSYFATNKIVRIGNTPISTHLQMNHIILVFI